MYRAVLFDLDGTLLNTIADLADAADAVCRDLHWPRHTQAAIQSMVGNGIPDLVSRFAPPGTEAKRLEEALTCFQAHYRRCCMEKTRPYPGIVQLLSRLSQADVKMGVLSNKADEFTKAITAHYFPGVFQAIRGSLPHAPAKPDGTAARVLADALGAAPVVLVGDSGVDIRTAENAGLACCAVTWGFCTRGQLLEAGAMRLADTPEQLLSLILSPSR